MTSEQLCQQPVAVVTFYSLTSELTRSFLPNVLFCNKTVGGDVCPHIMLCFTVALGCQNVAVAGAIHQALGSGAQRRSAMLAFLSLRGEGVLLCIPCMVI